MANAHDFELKRLMDKLQALTDEQKRVNQRILKSRREEQFELDHIRRKFSAQLYGFEERQKEITKDLERRERELQALRKRIKEEDDEALEEAVGGSSTHRRFRR